MFNSVQWDLMNKDPVYTFTICTFHLACTPDETKLWLSPSAKQRRNSCSGPPPVYQDLSTRHDWTVKKAIIDWPIRMKRNSKRTSSNSFSPLGSQNEDLGAASQTLLTEVKLRLWRRLLSTLPWLTQEEEFNLGIQIDNNVAFTLSRCLFCFRSVETV